MFQVLKATGENNTTWDGQTNSNPWLLCLLLPLATSDAVRLGRGEGGEPEEPAVLCNSAILRKVLPARNLPQIIVICTYTACAASFSFSIYLPYLRRAVVTSQIIVMSQMCTIYDANCAMSATCVLPYLPYRLYV